MTPPPGTLRPPLGTTRPELTDGDRASSGRYRLSTGAGGRRHHLVERDRVAATGWDPGQRSAADGVRSAAVMRSPSAIASFRVTCRPCLGVTFQRGVRTVGRVGADPRQATRRRRDRSSVRIAHDRRQPGDAGALRSRQPRRSAPSAHEPGIGVALLFVTLPFVVRAANRCCWIPRDRGSGGLLGANNWILHQGDAARLCPAAVGAGLAFASHRPVRFGGADGGAVPAKPRCPHNTDQDADQNDDPTGAAAISIRCWRFRSWCCSSCAPWDHVQPNAISWSSDPVTRGQAPAALSRAGLRRRAGGGPGRPDPVAHLRAGVGLRRIDRPPAAISALPVASGGRDRGARSTSCSGCRLVRTGAQQFRGKSAMQAVIDLPFAVSPVVVGVALILLWGSAALRFRRETDLGLEDHLRFSRHRAGQHLRHGAVRDP